ncbi:MAG: nicotinate-nucleotide diphosphorylase (carboxylating) [Bacteroidetes bacterium HGW-Bacteroidetes-5]|jgi:L-aspartate oxidase|nr:MAG: nicotinate-nucleotide diphosphorylase (carboxylating) [Bacteroidetes bacterium HGW-Bacteroidetes-5]
MKNEMQQYDYLIAGSGLAGLYAAFVASKYGSVAVVTKNKVSDSNTYYAQGGIASVTDNEDTPEFHSNDTITAGRGLCNPVAVDTLVNECPLRIKELIEDGMNFDMSGGVLALGLEGGHRRRRVLHAGGDITGRRISEFMTGQILSNPKITLFENHQALEIILDGKGDGGRCLGLKVWNFDTGRVENFYAGSTIMALGGASAIYSRTTNPQSSIGDGVALCYNAGCQIADMEFIQFHPTTLYSPDNKSYLISEAVRGEGAHLLNHNGERFMVNIHPLAELAPRDVVAQAIEREIKRDPHNRPYVYLSLKHLDSEKIRRRFPHIFQKCEDLGIDMRDKVPVAPAAHYMVGGVKSDIDGKTSITGLYVCGELASTGIMGANRLASNSLAECIVFGYRAVMSAKEHQASNLFAQESLDRYVGSATEPQYYIDSTKQDEYFRIREQISLIMTRYAGIVREREGLESALAELEQIRESLFAGDCGREFYSSISENLIIVATLVVSGALYREESRGGHFRSDYPKENIFNLFHTIQQKGKMNGSLSANWYASVKRPMPNNRKEITPKKQNNRIMTHNSLIDKIIDLAIEEDVASGDITTNSIILEKTKATAVFKMKADGVVSGISIIKRVFEHLDKNVIWRPFVKDGDSVNKEDVIVEIEGSYRCLLTSERIALNILQRMSGIATLTAQFVKEIEGTDAKILDTRKTAPGLRVLDKMAVAAGGGKNHRMGLYDMVLIKDNHIKIAGGIKNAVSQVRENINMGMKIEVETSNLDEVREAVECGADIIMLDNMDNDTMRRAIEIIAGRAESEASGNMTLDRVKEVAMLGVNYISVGALTHSISALDISMNVTVIPDN